MTICWGRLTAGRPGTHAAVTGACCVPTDIAYTRVVETLVGKLLTEHVLDAPEAAGGEGGLLGGGGDGAGWCYGEGGAGGEGADEAGDEGGHGGRHLGCARMCLLCKLLGCRYLEVVGRILFMSFVVEGALDEVGLKTRAGKIEQTPR